ncbi:hypothetical protein AVEN_260895-1 [Araneus ventricosus]|uniref:Uncharacterized protein n=1 Tax=Araneus ventricosus TaxID=182803 RepID=A0A4Y2HDV2_ARAVE|nr:hypothetical protein AVEN_260895-1 [Araneus ventricosus]
MKENSLFTLFASIVEEKVDKPPYTGPSSNCRVYTDRDRPKCHNFYIGQGDSHPTQVTPGEGEARTTKEASTGIGNRCNTHLKSSKCHAPSKAYGNNLVPGDVSGETAALTKSERRLLQRIIPYVKVIKSPDQQQRPNEPDDHATDAPTRSVYMRINDLSRIVRGFWNQRNEEIFQPGHAGHQCFAMVVANLISTDILPPRDTNVLN